MSAADEAREKLEGVTPGRWWWTDEVRQRLIAGGSPDDLAGAREIIRCAALLYPNKADAEFIAWCREGVPALVAELDQAKAQIERDAALATLREVREMCDRTGEYRAASKYHWQTARRFAVDILVILDRGTRLTKQQEELRTESGLLRKTIEKLVGVIDSLKLELAAEREAHTKLRDATARQRHIIVLDDLGNVSRCSCGLTFTDSGEALAHEAEMNG